MQLDPTAYWAMQYLTPLLQNEVDHDPQEEHQVDVVSPAWHVLEPGSGQQHKQQQQ